MNLAFLGAGNMAEAIVRALPDRSHVVAADPSEARRSAFEHLGVQTTDDLRPHLATTDVLVLAIKPQVAPHALPALAAFDGLVVSIMAGVTTAKIDALLGGGKRVVRVMPNTPMLLGRGACGIAAGASATADDVATARALFETAATVVEVPESLMDAVTAVSGSGPAYLFYLAEHLIAAGEAVGLSPADADALVRQTLLGAAEMLAAGESPAELRRRVTSPGGTTAAAIEAFEDAGTPAIVKRAVTAARDRGRALASNS